MDAKTRLKVAVQQALREGITVRDIEQSVTSAMLDHAVTKQMADKVQPHQRDEGGRKVSLEGVAKGVAKPRA